LRELKEWEVCSWFEDKFCHTDAKEGGARLASFCETAENVHFIVLVDEGMENPNSHILGVFFE